MKRAAYAKAKKMLSLLVQDRGDSRDLQHYGLVYSHRPDYWNSNTACYATIHGKERINSKCEGFYSMTQQEYKNLPLDKAGSRNYISWLIKHSPMSKVFKRKDVDKVLDEGIICHTDVPHTLFGAAIISQRMIWEFPNRIKVWNILVNAGVHERLAYMFMWWFTLSDDTVAFYAGYGGHEAMSGCSISKECLINFYKGTHKSVASFRTNRGYARNSSMWGESSSDFTEVLEEKFKERFPIITTQFGGKSGGTCTVKELKPFVLELQGTLFKELVA